MIHPQAIVHPEAKIGSDVHIGAFSIIGPDVEIGPNTWIGPHAVIHGPTRVGAENRIHEFCSLGGAPQHLGYKGEPTRLEIGSRNVIREYCTFSRGTAAGGGVTRLGDDNFVMAYCHVAHDCQVGSKTVFANGSSLAGHVHVGDHAVLGGFTLVHQFCRLGAHCMTAVNTVIFKDVPPFLICAGYSAEPHGINLRGLKRRGFSEAAIADLRRAYKVLYKSGLMLEEAVRQLEELAVAQPPVADLIAFIKASDRGIIR